MQFPWNSAIFCTCYSINSNSAISNWVRFFWDTIPTYSRNYCIYESLFYNYFKNFSMYKRTYCYHQSIHNLVDFCSSIQRVYKGPSRWLNRHLETQDYFWKFEPIQHNNWYIFEHLWFFVFVPSKYWTFWSGNSPNHQLFLYFSSILTHWGWPIPFIGPMCGYFVSNQVPFHCITCQSSFW